MGSATRAITDRVTKQIGTIFSKTCNKSFNRIILTIYRNKYSDISTYYFVLSNYYFDISK